MILKPSAQDFKKIGYYIGKIIIGLSLVMLIPVIVALANREINPALDFLIGLEIGLILGIILTRFCSPQQDLGWMQGMVVVSFSWLVATILGAIPLYLSGHWNSFLDACFDAMSGFTTTGLALVQDLDHISLAHNLWRHLIIFIGGQGIVIIALSFFAKAAASGAFRLYVGEARDERIMPNVISTARFIWSVSIAYLVLGTFGLGISGVLNGMRPTSAFFHGLCVFMAAFDTGGFAPQSQNILYYHNPSLEIVIMIIMILGTINFRLHYNLWSGNAKEIFRNIEIRTFFFAVIITFLFVVAGLTQHLVYPCGMVLFRKGFFQLLSAQTGTGYMTIYAQQFLREWGDLALVGIIGAMALGGAVCSTTGAIKMLRIGIIFKAFCQHIKKIILPEGAIFSEKIHHIKEVFLDDKIALSASLITLAYLLLYVIGAIVGVFYGYPFLYSLFESTSASANVGLSCGITRPDMPLFLKLTYMFQMWAGRLEFISAFTLIGFFWALLKGKR